jgi:hypothetical protein
VACTAPQAELAPLLAVLEAVPAEVAEPAVAGPAALPAPSPLPARWAAGHQPHQLGLRAWLDPEVAGKHYDPNR